MCPRIGNKMLAKSAILRNGKSLQCRNGEKNECCLACRRLSMIMCACWLAFSFKKEAVKAEAYPPTDGRS